VFLGPFQEDQTIRRILCFMPQGYLNDADRASAANRDLLECWASGGDAVEVLSREILDDPKEIDLVTWLAARGWATEPIPLPVPESGDWGSWPHRPSLLQLTVQGVHVTLLRGPSVKEKAPDDIERRALLDLLDGLLARFRPEVLLGHGTSSLATESLERGRTRDVRTALRVTDSSARNPDVFAHADAVLVPSRFLADYYREALGIAATVVPDLIACAQAPAERLDPGYVIFADTTPRQGVYAFARIAAELGRLRPDIPLLVAGRGTTWEILDGCGVDLKEARNLHLEQSPVDLDLRRLRQAARLVVVPALGWDDQARVAANALAQGLAVVASDRGAAPEVVGDAGLVLPLPDRITPATRTLPTAEEIAPWVEAIARLWDDAEARASYQRRALDRAWSWTPEAVLPAYDAVFQQLRRGAGPPTGAVTARAKTAVLVPFIGSIVPECERSLGRLEREGVRVVRRGGTLQIDQKRNEMLSDALHDGCESILFIDADIGFDPFDALHLLARPEPVVTGIYTKKGRRELASTFADGIKEILFGPDTPGLYPLKFAGAGFIRIRAAALRRMIDMLGLPLCNTRWGRGVWPFFQPLIITPPDEGFHYLGEDWSFSHRLAQSGIALMADTSLRLWHYGDYAYSWEDAGSDRTRYRSYNFRI
jgi:glycosyltransferase involved in cell wall biosynthesis